MGGEGCVDGRRDIALGKQNHRPPFDQRPGDLEATRGLGDGYAFMVVGARKADGWRGAIEVRRALDAVEMRELALEINRMADLFDERVDW